jgi:hypothetical protein
MSKFDDAVAKYAAANEELGLGLDADLITRAAKSLGPSIYLEDASRVSCSDKEEKDRVKERFLIKKMGMTDGPELDEAVAAVCDKLGSANRNKWRALFYAMLAKHFGRDGEL